MKIRLECLTEIFPQTERGQNENSLICKFPYSWRGEARLLKTYHTCLTAS